MVIFRKTLDAEEIYDVTYENGIEMGGLLRESDGYYVFYPQLSRGGAWPAHILRAIADKLDELNKPWDDIVAREAVVQTDFLEPE